MGTHQHHRTGPLNVSIEAYNDIQSLSPDFAATYNGFGFDFNFRKFAAHMAGSEWSPEKRRRRDWEQWVRFILMDPQQHERRLL
jgi:hypothetical protein